MRTLERSGVAIDFVDPETGFEALQDGDLLRTDDGGTTWDVVSHEGFAALSFVSSSLGFGLTDHAYVLETTDGGRSWRERLNGVSKPATRMPVSVRSTF